MPQSGQATFSAPLSSAGAAYLWDHQVSGKPLFPGAGSFEIALSSLTALKSSGKATCSVLGASIPAPLVLPPTSSNKTSGAAILLVSVSSALARLEVASIGPNARPTTHLAAGIGAAVFLEESQRMNPAVKLLKSMALSSMKPTNVASGSKAACATVIAPLHDASAYLISPSVLDNCLQLGAATPRADGELFVPAGVGAFAMPHQLEAASASSAIALPVTVSQSSTSALTDYNLMQGKGLGGCRVDCLEAKPLAGGATRRVAAAEGSKVDAGKDSLMYQIEWLRHSISEPSNIDEVLSKGTEIGQGSTAASLAGAISLAQVAAVKRLKGISLLTNGAAIGVSSQIRPSLLDHKGNKAAGLWGLARTVAAELPSQTTAVDLGGFGPTTNSIISVSEMPSKDVSSLVGSSAYGCRLEGGALTAATLTSAAIAPAMAPSRLFPMPRGALQNLLPEALSNKPLGAGRLFVAVKAVGINFRDVLNVLGMYPGDPGPPGGDCAGVVVAVGPNSNGLKPGKKNDC